MSSAAQALSDADIDCWPAILPASRRSEVNSPRARRGAAVGSTMRRAFLLGAALSAATGPAFAQPQSPELPEKTAPIATAAPPPFFTKGKGPGRNNSYLERFEEDYAYLKDPAKATDPFDPLKFIPLDPEGDVYLTLNGEIRFRFDDTDHRNFAIAPAAVPAKTPGGKPVFTAAAPGTTQLYRQRYALGGDLHLGPNLRLYADLYHGQQTGHDVGPAVPGNVRADLDLVDGFGEVYGIVDGAKTGFRAGRQQVYLGNNLQVRANISTNLPSPVFDGVRAYRDWGPLRIDAFAFDVVNFENGIFQGRDNARTSLWGGYASWDLPRHVAPGGDARAALDLFYLGWRSHPFANGKGSAVYDDRALLTGARIVAATGAGFVASQDHRHTLGLRFYGGAGDIDYDWQAALQGGSYAGRTVEAFAVNTDTGYTLPGLPWRPRLAMHLDAASGGAGKTTMNTYQPMYPNTQYYAPNNEFAPTNFYDFAPRVVVSPMPGVTVEAYYSLLWRFSEADAVYSGAPWPGGNGQNPYAATVLARGRAIGRQADLRVSWTITPHLLALAEAAVFTPGAAMRAAGGRTTTYLDFNLTFKF